MSIYNYSVKDAQGNDVLLSKFQGKVMLIVNTATGCGFTPHYEDLERIYEKFHDKGLEIVDIPCNQFGGQAPGSNEEIHEFCTLHYNTKFPQMKKSDVNGENELPLYTYLKKEQGFKGLGEHPFKDALEQMFLANDPNWDKNPDIKWNFTKFIVNREGTVVERFEPTEDMKNIEAYIEKIL
ncbi:MAG: glutathione peroxidase [Eubacterium sp.]|nr:glutathione peroxidase [Eubacterium sp.]